MSLATRCSACGTLFRVVQDQLRVSEGWVRCGRCDTVFNAFDALVDLEAEAAAAGADAVNVGAKADAELDDTQAAHHAANHAPEARHEGPGFPPVDPGAALLEGLGEPPPESVEAPTVSALLQPPATSLSEIGAVVPQAGDAKPLPATPGFVRRADRNARWTSPAMRAALLGSALMLLAMLGLQVVFHFRDSVAARSPAAGDLLRGACAHWGCRVEAPRRLHEVTLEGSGLSRVAQLAEAVKLSISLRNRGNTDLALPSVDLSLTDAKGALIARRALSPQDFHIAPPVIARGAELPLELVLSAGGRTISGYTVELFYP